MTGGVLASWTIAFVATAGVILRPWRLPEAVWAVAGALLLVGLGLLPVHAAIMAVGKGTDVYLFLVGMMLLSEVARREGLFDVLAAHAAARARGSARRLFLLIYGVGVVVTTFLSNDATAVVLTPAVFAAARAAGAEPLPYLYACAFIANAASFVLPISNPANLVLYASHMPPLLVWLGRFAVPSVLSIIATYGVLRFAFRNALRETLTGTPERRRLGAGGVAAASGIVATAILLMAASAFDAQLGLPTALAGIATAAFVLLRKGEAPWALLRSVSWSVLPLVAGLFVLVESLAATGVVAALAHALHDRAARDPAAAAWGAGTLLAFASNLMNNLPAGLLASSAAHAADVPRHVIDALLVGVDLGPNLSITGSLATILWLAAIRREGEDVTFLQFLRHGAVAMPVALVLALAGLALA